MKSKFIFFTLFYLLSEISNSFASKIAIIGGGIGGTSTAYFLSKTKAENTTLTIFEDGDIGGRLKTVELAGKTYECGGTIIHPANKLMVDLTKELELEHRTPGPDSRLTLISDKGVIFQQWSYFQSLQFLYRYGLFGMLKLQYYISNMLEHFAKIYTYLDQGLYVESVEKMLEVMSPSSRKNRSNDHMMVDLTEISLADELKRQNMPQILIDELVQAAVRVNYGQNTFSTHAFVGSVALAGAVKGLWSIKGGNHLLAGKLLLSSGASVIQKRVQKVSKKDSGFVVNTEDKVDHDFDIVILATPMTNDTEAMHLEGTKPINTGGQYHRTVATIVEGEIDPAFIGLSEEELTNDNFILDPNNNVNSFALLSPVDYEDGDHLPSVWKVFSQKPLEANDLDQIFKTRKEVKVCDWLAYPQYDTNQTFYTNFKLDDNLYHINAIEWAASAMEMSVIGAKNVANMIAKDTHTKSRHSPDEL